VLTVLGVLAAVVGPEMARLTPTGADRTVRDLLAAAGRARDLAGARGEPVTIAIETRSGAFLIFAGAGPRAGEAPLAEGAIRLPDGVHLEAPTAAPWAFFRFDGLGRARGDRLIVSDYSLHREIAADAWTASLVATTR
jgi:hypothetical protein